MSTPRDDDALSWDGDDDPTLDPGKAENAPRPDAAPRRPAQRDAAAPARPLPTGFTAVGKGSERVAPPSPAPEPLGNAALVGIGMIAAAFILFSVGWLIVSVRLQAVADALPVAAPILVTLTLAAAAAPLVWFGTVYALTRRSRTWVRFAWLVVGVVLLVPWPFLGTGSFA
ncbi:DNA polymerase III subunit gamma/tau [Microbacterium sp. 10M-3C3]|uniref:DNA polymerase III subunit gamma/tau n=1 Tax=Microbacterium sp. 10M-3C3 TaxID=2483401 RepID=UPI000F6351CB|nr:DNA polymerase III subunit gamma/tau [Microbacterium sp. 10M-3C3]